MGACVRGDTKGGSQDVPAILSTAWEPVSEGTPREDPRMSQRSSVQHGSLCPRGPGSLGFFILQVTDSWARPGYEANGQLCERNMKGGSWDVQGILRTAWRPVSEGTPRENPRMSKGSTGQHGAYVWGDMTGGSRDVVWIPWTAWAASLIPRPRSAFHRFQYERAWYLSHMNDVGIERMV